MVTVWKIIKYRFLKEKYFEIVFILLFFRKIPLLFKLFENVLKYFETILENTFNYLKTFLFFNTIYLYKYVVKHKSAKLLITYSVGKYKQSES